MATIISKNSNLAFIHIPKCAGMSISTQLRELVQWDHRFTWEKVVEPEVGKKTRGAHMTLQQIRLCFPEIFEFLRSSENYAVLRDPFERFPSSMNEYFKKIKGCSMRSLSQEDLITETNNVLLRLSEHTDWIPEDLIHFTRQIDYVYCDNECIVSNTYTINNLLGLAADLSNKHNLSINPTAQRNAGLNANVKPVSGALSVKTIRRSLRKFALSAACVLKSNEKISRPARIREIEGVFQSPEVNDFILEFYDHDIQLFKKQKQLDLG